MWPTAGLARALVRSATVCTAVIPGGSGGGDGGDGGDGGASAPGGSGGTGGQGGAAGTGRMELLFNNDGTPGVDGADGGGVCLQSCPLPSQTFAPYIDMGSLAQRAQTWFMNDSTDPTKPGTPSLVSTMEKTGIQAATLAFVNQQSAGGDLIWGSARLEQKEFNIPVNSEKGAKIEADIRAAIGRGLTTIVSFGGITACTNGVEIGQLNGKATFLESSTVEATGQKVVTLNLPEPIDFAAMEPGSITGRFLIYGGPTELFQVNKDGTFSFDHIARYDSAPRATGGSLAADGRSITIELDNPLTANLGNASVNLDYGLQAGFDQMKQAYKGAIQYFYDLGVRHIDLDIEGKALQDPKQWGINNQRNRVFKALQDENAFPDMKLSFVLPIGPNTGWAPNSAPGLLIWAAGKTGLKVDTWNMMAFDYGPQVYNYMLTKNKNMVDVLIEQAQTGSAADPNNTIRGAVDYLVQYKLAANRQDAFKKLGVTLMVGQDDTIYDSSYPYPIPSPYVSGDAAVVEAITPAQVGGSSGAATVLDWATRNGVGLLSFWSLGRDRPSFNTVAYNPELLVTYQTGSPANRDVKTAQVAGAGSASVTLPFTPAPRTVQGGSVFLADKSSLGDFVVNKATNTLTFTYVADRPVKPTGGTINPAGGSMQITFNGPVTETIWAQLGLDPLILKEYQTEDLVYTKILNAFD